MTVKAAYSKCNAILTLALAGMFCFVAVLTEPCPCCVEIFQCRLRPFALMFYKSYDHNDNFVQKVSGRFVSRNNAGTHKNDPLGAVV